MFAPYRSTPASTCSSWPWRSGATTRCCRWAGPGYGLLACKVWCTFHPLHQHVWQASLCTHACSASASVAQLKPALPRYHPVPQMIRNGQLCGQAIIAYLQVRWGACACCILGTHAASSTACLESVLALCMVSHTLFAQPWRRSRCVYPPNQGSHCLQEKGYPEVMLHLVVILLLFQAHFVVACRRRGTPRWRCTLCGTSASASTWRWSAATSRWRCRARRWAHKSSWAAC